MASYLVYLNFINLLVHKSYIYINECASPFDELRKRFRAGLVHFYIWVLYAVTPKIVKSNDNVLSYTSVNFNDCLNGGQLHYDGFTQAYFCTDSCRAHRDIDTVA